MFSYVDMGILIKQVKEESAQGGWREWMWEQRSWKKDEIFIRGWMNSIIFMKWIMISKETQNDLVQSKIRFLKCFIITV